MTQREEDSSQQQFELYATQGPFVDKDFAEDLLGSLPQAYVGLGLSRKEAARTAKGFAEKFDNAGPCDQATIVGRMANLLLNLLPRL